MINNVEQTRKEHDKIEGFSELPADVNKRTLGMLNIQPHCDYSISGKTLIEINDLLERAKSIMEFHADRCPLHPKTNFSGCEEHLAEYRSVMRDIDKILKK